MEFALLCFFAAFCLIIGRITKPDGALKHQHIWQIRSVHPLRWYNNGKDQLPSEYTTDILKVCFCGETKVERINGTWQLKDFDTL